MKIKYIPIIFSVSAIMLLSSSAMFYPGGSPAAKTGSPGDGANCSQCHGGTATTTAGQITSNIPVSGYIAGQTYQITATNPLTGSGKYGFEVSPQNLTGTQLGTLVAGTGNKLVGGTKYVTQSNSNSSTNTWTFSWIAPVSGTGAVTFYGAFAKNYSGPTTLSTLTVQEAASVPAGAGPINGPVSVCKNNTETYSVSAIAGATGYVWTVPAGATIESGQGTTSVNVSFGVSALSGDLSVYGSNNAGNGAPSNLMITVNSVPEIPASPDGPDLVDLQNTSISDYSTASGAPSYGWQLSPASAGIISGTSEIAQVTWNNSFTGNAEISVKGTNSCGESSWSTAKITQVLNTSGLSESATGIKVISGVSGEYLTLDMNTNANQANVILLDLSGRVLMHTTIPGQGKQQIRYRLKSGIYIILIDADSSRVSQKILVI